ncbi:MAG: TonB-dependent receptor, partial [Candidatus Kapaibacterium sp.]
GEPGPVGTISGAVVDAASGTALARATIALRNGGDSLLVTGAIAERDGSFSISGIGPGSYYARVSFVGYTPRLIDVAIRPGALDVALGTIALQPDPSLRNEVTVSARRQFMTQAIDRTIYKTADLLVADGGTAIDLLRNVPSVDVDATSRVSLRGNQNLVVHINGRPSLLTGDALTAFLQGLPADAIERIEVLPNPSAKYDPDGISGIINIVLKQHGNHGLSGGVNTSIGTHDNYTIGGNLGYRGGPWTISASYGFTYGTSNGSENRVQTDMRAALPTYQEKNSVSTEINRSHVLNGSIDYAIDNAQTLTLSAILNKRIESESGVNAYMDLDGGRQVTGRSRRGRDESHDAAGSDYRLGYKWAPEPGKHELSAEVRYRADRDPRLEHFVQENLAPDGSYEIGIPGRQRTSDVDDDHAVTIQADYARPLGNGRLEAGYKGDIETIGSDIASESIDSTSGIYHSDAGLDNTFAYDRRIQALYGSYGLESGGFGAQAGVRLEQAWTSFNLTTTKEAFDNNYFSIFPSAFISYKPSDALLFKASYSRRINRPDAGSLNPFDSFEDPLFRHVGNPALKPEYINSMEFSISHFTEKTTLALTPFYRQTLNSIGYFLRIDSSGVSTLTFENFGVSSSAGADLVGSAKIGEWLNAVGNLGAYRIVTDGSNVESGLSNDAFGWNGRINATVEIIPGFDFQGSYSYYAPIKIEGGVIAGRGTADVAVRRKLFDNRGALGLRVSDLFNTSGFNITHIDGGFTQELHRRWTSRVLDLTFRYSFGGSADQDMMNAE